MSNVQCLGTESRLIDCPHSSGGGGSGGLWSDATLSCYPFSSGKCSNSNLWHVYCSCIYIMHALKSHHLVATPLVMLLESVLLCIKQKFVMFIKSSLLQGVLIKVFFVYYAVLTVSL